MMKKSLFMDVTQKKVILQEKVTGVITLLTTFDWKVFQSKDGYKETLADHSDMKLQLFEKNGKTINYVCGSVIYKHDLDDSYKVHCILQYKNGQSQKFAAVPGIPDRTFGACEFIVDFIRKYMLPMTRHHNDFPSRIESWCPLKARTYNIYQVENVTQLIAPSDLEPAEYKIYIMYRKDGLDIGGYEGRFLVMNS